MTKKDFRRLNIWFDESGMSPARCNRIHSATNSLLTYCEEDEEDSATGKVGFVGLIVQGIATSIDALSVGLDIGAYGILEALVCCLLIAFVTFFICMGGLILGKKVGTKLAGKAAILGGSILIFIGLEIFVTGVFF